MANWPIHDLAPFPRIVPGIILRRMLNGVIFDFDGLILDTESPDFQSWSEIYESYGQVLTLETWSSAIGTRGGFDPYSFLEEMLGKAVDRDAIRTKRRARESQLSEALPVLGGFEAILKEARDSGLSVGIASSSDESWVLGHLGRFGLAESFDSIQCTGGRLRPKPAPDLYIEALGELHLSAHEAVAFEDSPNGVAAAKAANIFCVAVPNALTSGLDLSAADMVVSSLTEVQGRLTRILPADQRI